MSHIANGVFGALAISLTCGAIQLASGRDLVSPRQDPAPIATQENSYAVNRRAKSDRGAVASNAMDRSQTLSFRVNSIADTSVAMRLPAVQLIAPANTERASGGAMLSRTDRKLTVACEPVVSVLTEVAKLLEPGRCLT